MSIEEAIENTTPAKNGAAPLRTPKWELDAKERIKSSLRNAQRALPALVARDANEGDTRLFVTQFLCDALGYDLYEDLTTEYQVKGEFADYGVRIDKQLVAFIEVKRITTKLGPKHLRQVEVYAINEGVEWAILTNGVDWQVYHLAAAAPKVPGAAGPLVEVDLTLEVNLLGDSSPSQKVQKLFLLSRESLKKRQIDELWKARRATAPKSVAKVLCSAPVLDAIRKEIRRSTGHNPETAELLGVLRNAVIRQDCL